MRTALEELGRDLFILGRSAVDCDRYLGGMDRKLLLRRLDEYREMGVISRRATAEADALESRLRLLDDLVEERERTASLAAETERSIDELRACITNGHAGKQADTILADLETFGGRARAAAYELQDRLAKAQKALGDAGIALKHTRHRGVFSSGSRYVVPFFDELGIEQRREFASLDEAQAFRRSLRLVESEREEQYTDSSITGQRQWGAEQGILKPRDERR